MKKAFVWGVVFALMAAGASSSRATANTRTLVAQNSSDTSSTSSANNTSTATHKKKLKKKMVAKKKAQAVRNSKRITQQKRTLPRPMAKKTVNAKTVAPAPQQQRPAAVQTTQSAAPAPYVAPRDSVQTLSPIPTVTTQTKPEPTSSRAGTFSFKYRSNNGEMLNAVENPYAPQNDSSMDHNVQAWDRINVTYHINDNVSIDLMPQFYHTWFGDQDRLQSQGTNDFSQPYAGYMGETGLGVIDSKIAVLPGGWVLDGYAGYFFPTAEWEQYAGTLGATRTNLGLGRSFGKLDLKWIESVWWYFEQYATSTAFDTGVNWNPATNSAVDPTQYFRPPMPMQNVAYNVWSLWDMTWNFTKKFYVDFTSGFMNQMSYADNNPATARPAVLNDYLILDPEIGYQFNKFFALCVGLWEEADMRNQTEPYVPFNGSTLNTEAYFMTTLSF